MFLESHIIPPANDFHKTEFLTEAAFAIVSSLASSDSDVGVDLATRLLLPYIPQADTSPEVAACLAEILEHYNPSSDVSARNILDRCEKVLVQKKNRRLLEACVGIVVCRYRLHLEQLRTGVAIAWLFRGIKMESLVIDNVEEGSCFNVLSVLCYSTSENILEALSAGVEVAEEFSVAAKEMKVEVDRADLSSERGLKMRDMCPVVVFMQVQAVLENITMGDRFIAATCIVTCLEKGSDGNVGLPSTFMPVPLQVLLLKIACKLIEDEFEEVAQAGGVSTTSVFDKRGASTLLESMMVSGASDKITKDGCKIRDVLLRAVSQATISENALKRPFREGRGGHVYAGSVDIFAVRTDALANHPRDIQEAVVERLLNF